jgi:hypothetical protein
MSINLQISEFRVPDSELGESGIGQFAVPIFTSSLTLLLEG